MSKETVKNPARFVLIYGKPGIGKTTYAKGAPKPVWIPTERVTNKGIAVWNQGEFPRTAATLGEFTRQLNDFANNHKDEYQTLVIDSATGAETLMRPEIEREYDNKPFDKIGYAAADKAVKRYWLEIMPALTHILEAQNVNILVLAHTRKEAEKPPNGELYDRIVPDINKHANELLDRAADDVLYLTNCPPRLHKEKLAFNASRTVVVDAPLDRVIYVSPSASHCAKNRLDLPEGTEFTLNPQEYWGAVQAYYADDGG